MYRAALEEVRDSGEGRGRLPYRMLLEELRKQEQIEHNRERKEMLQTLVLLTIAVVEIEDKLANLGLLIEKLVP